MALRLELRGIGKRFGSVVANEGIDLAVAPGDIHALLGENGAGKSTLMKIVFGLLRPDAGSILWEDREVSIDSPQAARALGIGMVFQHFSLFERLSVLENVALSLSRHDPDLERRIREVSAAYGLPLDPARKVWSLSVGERQRIEIVRCLLQSPRLLILDEPTSVLTPQEAETLFATLRQLAAEGCSILYISHKLEEIRALCHRATVLRAGRIVAACDPAQESAAGLARMMIGSAPPTPARTMRERGPVRLAVDGLTIDSALRGVSFSVRAGEILGIAGVAGNGQAELFAGLSGEVLAATASMVQVDGVAAGRLGPRQRRLLGVACVPEERNGHAAVPGFSLTQNAVLTGHARMRLARLGVVRWDEAARFARDVQTRFAVRAAGVGVEAASLSGGNLQKFVVGREVLQRPEVLIAAQPTWGVDAGAAAAIHRAILDLAAAGSAVVLISQDLDELLAISDRIAVMAGGRLTEAGPADSVAVETIGLLMADALAG